MRKILITATLILTLVYSYIIVVGQQSGTAKNKSESSKLSAEEQDPKALIERAINVIGLRKVEKAIHLQAMESTGAPEQSDRSYGPFLNGMISYDIWYD